MAKIILVTGGQRSGKSSFSEKLLEKRDDVLYIATAVRTDREMEERIKRHRQMRNSKWETLEGFKNLGVGIKESGRKFILLDCVTNMVSNLIFTSEDLKDIDPDELKLDKDEKDRLYSEIKSLFEEIIEAVRNTESEIIFVSNEVGMGLVSEYPLGRLFTDFAGFINQYIASVSDEVYFMVSGIPVKIK